MSSIDKTTSVPTVDTLVDGIKMFTNELNGKKARFTREKLEKIITFLKENGDFLVSYAAESKLRGTLEKLEDKIKIKFPNNSRAKAVVKKISATRFDMAAVRMPSEITGFEILKHVPPKEHERTTQHTSKALASNIKFQFLSNKAKIEYINTHQLPIRELGFETVDQLIDFLKTFGMDLTFLDLSGYRVTKDQIIELHKHCPHLESLGIATMAELGLNSIEELVEFLQIYGTLLTHLDLTDLPIGLNTDQVGQIATYCPNLISFTTFLSHGPNRGERISDASIEQIAELTRLKHLNLQLHRLTDDQLSILVKRCPNLESLSISQSDITNASLLKIAMLTKLQELKLYNCIELTALPDEFRQLTELRVLNLDRCHGFLTLQPVICRLLNLEILSLDECRRLHLTDEIAKLPKLQKLILTGYPPTKFSKDFIAKFGDKIKT